eukprot:gene23997-27153_t
MSTVPVKMSYNEVLMRQRIEACLKTVTTVMEKGRSSKIHAADQVAHQYADKFLLADTITNTMCASLVHCFSVLGLDLEQLKKLKSWGAEKTVTLDFRFTRKTTLLREQERDVEKPTRLRKSSKKSGTSTISVITKVKEYVFLEEQTHQLVAFTGVGDNAAEFIVVWDHAGSTECISTDKSEEEASSDHLDTDLSWLLGVLSADDNAMDFSIDRSDAACFTPVENRDIKAAAYFGRKLREFAVQVFHVLGDWRDVQGSEATTTHSPPFAFNPVAPLFEAADEHGTTPISFEVISGLLNEYQRQLVQVWAEVGAALPSPALFGRDEAKLEAVMDLIDELSHSYLLSIDFLENMIRKQLVAAIGKTVSAQDFA